MAKSTKPQTSAATQRTWPSAMDKIRDLTAEATRGFDKFLGQQMTELLIAHPDWEQAILAPGKDLNGLYKAFYDYAYKNKQGACFAGTPDDARKIICEYFEVTEDDPAPLTGPAVGAISASPESAQPTTTTPPAAPAPDPFDLDALIGGF